MLEMAAEGLKMESQSFKANNMWVQQNNHAKGVDIISSKELYIILTKSGISSLRERIQPVADDIPTQGLDDIPLLSQ